MPLRELDAVWQERLAPAKGDARHLKHVFHRSLAPMSLLDNERRHRDVNTAFRLLFRRSHAELIGMRVDDLTPAYLPMAAPELFERLGRDDAVAGEYKVRFPDGPQATIAYSGVRDMLPARHLFVLLPVDWPERELRELVAEEPTAPTGPLTPRERQVLGLIAEGHEVVEVAEELSLSVHTVVSHVRKSMRRLGARNRAQAIALAFRAGDLL